MPSQYLAMIFDVSDQNPVAGCRSGTDDKFVCFSYLC